MDRPGQVSPGRRRGPVPARPTERRAERRHRASGSRSSRGFGIAMSRMKESLRVRETATRSGSSRPGESLRVGFLGTGYIADWHAKALGTIPGVSLVAGCDKDLPRARTFGERYGAARCYESLEQMLGDAESELDVVHVLLPPDLHALTALTLIDAGLHVFLEKPMATDAQECASLVEQATRRGVTI